MKKGKILDSNLAYSIGIIRTDRIGDMVLTLPMARLLKSINPYNKITIFANKYVEPLLENNPFIDEYYLIENINDLNYQLKVNKFDIIFFPRPKFDEAFTVYKNHIKHRVGTAYRLYSVLFNHKLKLHRKTAQFHEAEYNNKLIEILFDYYETPRLIKPNININSENKISQILDELNINKFFIIHPGTGGSSNDWSLDKFSELAELINKKLNIKIILTGSDNEKIKTNYIKNKVNDCIDFAGKFNLSELIALISKSTLLIANSTGIIHIAASLDIPVIGLYPNSPHLSNKRWGPYTNNKLIYNPIYSNELDKDNMDLISVNDVFDGIKRIIEI